MVLGQYKAIKKSANGLKANKESQKLLNFFACLSFGRREKNVDDVIVGFFCWPRKLTKMFKNFSFIHDLKKRLKWKMV